MAIIAKSHLITSNERSGTSTPTLMPYTRKNAVQVLYVYFAPRVFTRTYTDRSPRLPTSTLAVSTPFIDYPQIEVRAFLSYSTAPIFKRTRGVQWVRCPWERALRGMYRKFLVIGQCWYGEADFYLSMLLMHYNRIPQKSRREANRRCMRNAQLIHQLH